MDNNQFDLPESPIQEIYHALLEQKGIKLSIKRDDLLHPVISGNKWRKLKYNLIEMQNQRLDSFMTFAGPFSNHLYACAMACKVFNLEGHAIIRGPELDANNPTIKMAMASGMQLNVVNRKTYRQRHELDFTDALKKQYPNSLIIPEGGTNEAALLGVVELARSLPKADFILCPTGSGGTLAGLAKGSSGTSKVIGIGVLKQSEYLNQEIARLVGPMHTGASWELLTDYHDGGYGKFTEANWQFCEFMQKVYKLPLEPIYTGKMLFALWQLIKLDYFPRGSHLVAIHTGGLQGLNGLKYRGLIPR